MRRRQFLRNTALFGVPFALKGIPVAALPYFGPLGGLEEENDRVLVLVQLIGGNDGLNTFIPLDQYRNLNKHRGDILIPENKILSLDREKLEKAMKDYEAKTCLRFTPRTNQQHYINFGTGRG